MGEWEVGEYWLKSFGDDRCILYHDSDSVYIFF